MIILFGGGDTTVSHSIDSLVLALRTKTYSLDAKIFQIQTLSNTFEGGTNGVQINSGNSGGASGDAFDQVAGSPYFKSNRVFEGSMAGGAGNGGFNIGVYWDDNSIVDPVTEGWTRGYYQWDGTTATREIWQELYESGQAYLGVQLSINTNELIFWDVSTDVATHTISLSADTWYRLETHFIFNGTSSTIGARIFVGSSIIPLYSFSTSVADCGGNNRGNLAGFYINDTSGAERAWMDSVAFTDEGPFTITGTTHEIDNLLKKTQTNTHSIDTLLTVLTVGSETHSIDAFMVPETAGSKTHSIDFIRKKTGLTVTHRIDTILFDTSPALIQAVDSLISDPTNDPVANGTIAEALAADIIRPTIRISRIAANNVSRMKAPKISTGDDDGEEIGAQEKVIVDGYEFSSMKYAFADSDATTNAGYRLFPDFDKFESDEYLEKRRVPWISESSCDANGQFSPPIIVTVEYDSPREYNMIQIVTDQFGKNNSGIITDMDIDVSDDGVNWTSAIPGVSGMSMEEIWRVQVFYFYDPAFGTEVYSMDKKRFLENASTNSVLTSNKFFRFTINAISVDPTVSSDNKPRHLMLYEAGSFIWDVDLVTDEVTSVNIQESRDLSSQTLSPIGSSAANTFSVNTTLARYSGPKYSLFMDPADKSYDSFRSAYFKLEIGFHLTDGTVVHMPYGTYLVDDLNISSDGTLSYTGRDFSTYLQDGKMPPMVYQGYYLSEVLRDVAEKAGIEKLRFDDSAFSTEELAIGVTEQFVNIDEKGKIVGHNIIWSDNKTYWEFLQDVAYADLGAFYFDRDNTFVYKSKEEYLKYLQDVDYELTEDRDILGFSSSNEVLKNQITMSYTVPEIPEDHQGIWDAGDNVTLSSTALSAPVDSGSDTILVGDISDWEKQGFFKIDDEIVKYSDRNDNAFLSCERGWLGTTAAPHYPETNEENWNFSGGDWEISGGVLTARNQAGAWGTAITVDTITGSRYNIAGKLTINKAPYRAAVLVKVGNPNRYYRLVIKSVAQPGSTEGISNTEDVNLYELWSVNNDTETLLKATKKRTRVVTGITSSFTAQVDGRQISLFIRGSKVLSYMIDDDDLNVDFPAQIGLSARGRGPTTFENLVVRALPEGGQGRVVLFSEPFGAPIYEVKRFEATYDVPSIDILYYLTNSEEAQVIFFKAEPNQSILYVLNLKDGITQVTNGASDDDLPNFFYLTGLPVHDGNTREKMREDESSITRYGLQSLDVQLPWVESDLHAQILLEYLKKIYSTSVINIDAQIVPNPLIELSDTVSISSLTVGNPIWFAGRNNIDLHTRPDVKFHVIGNNIEYGSGGISQTLQLRTVANAALIPFVGPTITAADYVCAIEPPLPSFYGISVDDNTQPEMSYTGYSETIYEYGDTDGVFSTDGLSIPVTVWRPSLDVVAPDESNILPSGSSPVSGLYPTIIWLHNGYERTWDEEPDDYNIKRWLIKIVRLGFNVVFVKYRGTGGISKEFFDASSYLLNDLEDVIATKEWIEEQGYHNGVYMGVMGYGHGANMVYGLMDRGFTHYVPIDGSPNLACTMQRNIDKFPKYIVDRYMNSLGDFTDPRWLDICPMYMDIPTTNPVLMTGSQKDNYADVKDLWHFYEFMTEYGNTPTTMIFDKKVRGWIFQEDGSRPNTNFKSDYWRKLADWLINV